VSLAPCSGKWKKSSIIKVLLILFGHPCEVELIYRYIFAFKFFDTEGKFAANVIDTSGNLPPVLLIPMVHLDLRISRIFKKILNGPNGILWGWGETDSCKKPEAKNLMTLSL
jgi:hypothetical protein